ncbi:nucleotide-diphospho-sugar transferase [Pedobacter hiemivivus]|uniref:Nucleotide-diphospho-sugar transferase n=1 Tax=Pedobacter hiemivivus TaxID=2530454 RepID=A0A4R0NB92_9SPHI|nr:nucleotide-diphospho-sugar transferase [Pedobacter hiemivivus]TCC97561.1 nucleotide-diphospho-sugar transferase [Pedobacter hiemivivus]
MIKYNREDAVLFLVFNRADTTSKVFQAIKEAEPKRLYVAADGPRNVDEFQKCKLVREIATNVTWDCELKVLFQEENLGCRVAVSNAINWFFEAEEQGIILEDDCLPSSSFFGFCSSLLEKYKDDDRIGHISGANFQNGIKRGESSYYFSRLPHIWGWASWRRAWNNYDVNMSSFASFKESDLENLASHAPYKETWYKNLHDTYHGKIDTWDYQYSYFTIIHNYLSIAPNQNFIKNIGFGADATHTIGDHEFANLETVEIDSIVHPYFFIPNVEADLYTQQRQEYEPPIKQKNVFSRTWKKIKGK